MNDFNTANSKSCFNKNEKDCNIISLETPTGTPISSVMLRTSAIPSRERCLMIIRPYLHSLVTCQINTRMIMTIDLLLYHVISLLAKRSTCFLYDECRNVLVITYEQLSG